MRWAKSNVNVKAVNLSDFFRQVEKELKLKKGSYITIGVEERSHWGRVKEEGENRGLVGNKSRVTTTQIAYGHEFGNSFTPKRSFLKLTADRFVKSNLSEIAKKDYKYIGSFLKALTTKIYDMIIDCFVSNGFGTWRPLSEDYKKDTGRSEPALIDTGQLMTAVYAQYEGFTVKGKQVGRYMSSDFISGFANTEDKDKKPVPTKEKKAIVAPIKEKNIEARSSEYEKNTKEDYFRRLTKEVALMKEGYIKQFGKKEYLKRKGTLEQSFLQRAQKKISSFFRGK